MLVSLIGAFIHNITMFVLGLKILLNIWPGELQHRCFLIKVFAQIKVLYNTNLYYVCDGVNLSLVLHDTGCFIVLFNFDETNAQFFYMHSFVSSSLKLPLFF